MIVKMFSEFVKVLLSFLLRVESLKDGTLLRC